MIKDSLLQMFLDVNGNLVLRDPNDLAPSDLQHLRQVKHTIKYDIDTDDYVEGYVVMEKGVTVNVRAI